MNKTSKQNLLRYLIFLLACTSWVGVFFILSEFIDYPKNDIISTLVILAQWAFICFCAGCLIYLLSANKYIFAVFFPLISILGSILTYYKLAYKATLTPMLIDAALHNDLRTSLDVVSPTLIVVVVMCLAISMAFVWVRFKKIQVDRAYLHFLIAIVLLYCFFNISPRIRISINQRFPFSVYANIAAYQYIQHEAATVRVDPDADLQFKSSDSLTVVFVIGESLRADHLSLNGYKRLTNPKLAVQKNIVSFPNIFSEYTFTNRSLPHILTRADSAHTELAFTETSFIKTFRKCGYATLWVSNQDYADTYTGLMKESDSIIFCHPEKSVYNFNLWLDEDLLPHVKRSLNKESNSSLIVLHTIGSHWYYNSHFSADFEKFKPITSSKVLSQCSPTEIINSYDNSALYTDFFLDELIKLLEHKKAILIYLSDHGETLGENGEWLHAGENSASKNPACIIWYSNSFNAQFPEKVNALKANKNGHFRTDFLYHSILNAGNIPSKRINSRLDIFSKQ